jgi:hypothetical protein
MQRNATKRDAMHSKNKIQLCGCDDASTTVLLKGKKNQTTP